MHYPTKARVQGKVHCFLAAIVVLMASTIVHTQGPAGAQVGIPRAYVANFFDGTVSVIDSATKTVTATIPVGTLPSSVAFSPDGATD